MVVGFLTNTNQFVQINEPVPISRISQEHILTITSNDTLLSDINTLTSTKVDNRRVDYIKRVNLETNFYNTFRNTIRILFNDYSNSNKRREIMDALGLLNKNDKKDKRDKRGKLLKTKEILYKELLKKITDSLITLVGDNIEFVEDFDYKSIIEDDIQTCIKNTSDTCNVSPTSICKISESKKGGKCVIQFPSLNLVSKQPNEEYYYGRMADELIRYNRIKSFIFKPQSYLSFGQVKYNLRDNEIIVLQDMLNQEFFENLIPSDINKYAKYNTSDNAEPITEQIYNNTYEYDITVNTTKVIDCRRSEPKAISGASDWKFLSKYNFKEVEYSNSPFCPLYLIIDLYKEFYNEEISIERVKQDLIDEYNRLTDNFTNVERYQKILAILKDEELHSELTIANINKGMTIEQMIILEGFNAGNFDLWVLLSKYKIPSMMITKKNFEYRNNKAMVCWRPESGNDYAIIYVPKVYRKAADKDTKDTKDTELNQYKLIKDENKRIKININIFNNPIKYTAVNFMNQAISKYYSIEYYLDNVFNKVPLLSKKTLAIFDKSERKLARKELVEEVEVEELEGEEEEGQHVMGEKVLEKQQIVEKGVDEIPDIVAFENSPNIQAITKKRGRPKKVIDPNEKPKAKSTRKQKIISLPVFVNEEL
jgi:hypothetical protein